MFQLMIVRFKFEDENMTNDAALVLFSGGQDSTTCLAWALDRFSKVETVGFDYGQRHLVEMDARTRVLQAFRDTFLAWAGKLGGDHVLKIDALAEVSETSLTRDVAIAMQANGLPNSFVPGRNLLFLTFAAPSPIDAGSNIWSWACARPIIPAILIAGTTPSKQCKSRLILAWRRGSSFIRL
jgi:hypothetical protein